MKTKSLIILFINLVLLGGAFQPVFALEHAQKDGLFSMDIPEAWHWVENAREIIITYPDGNTVAIDIQMVPSRSNLSQADMDQLLKDSDDKMIKEGILAHNGTLLDQKQVLLGGVKADQLDFKTTPPNPIEVTYISFFYKSYAFTITYGSTDDKMRSVMDDAIATMKFN